MGLFRKSGIKRRAQSMREAFPFDPETQYPIIRASICTGERAAGFKDKASGRFTEVMLIRSADDEALFKEAYGLGEVKTEY